MASGTWQFNSISSGSLSSTIYRFSTSENLSFVKFSFETFSDMDIEIPDEKLAGNDIEHLFEHSDLQKRGNNYFRESIRYFHEPFDIHQESLENGELHKKLQAITFSIFRASSKERLMKVIKQKIAEWIEKFERPIFTTNLVDEVRLVITRFFYELILENNVSEDKTLIYFQSATNFHKTLKGEELRSLGKHLRMYEDIKRQLEAPNQFKWLNKENLNPHEREILAKHIGGVFFIQVWFRQPN